MSITEDGRAGEVWAREWLLGHGYEVILQADWIARSPAGLVLVEVKHQERFEPPPFFGHGLPPWQVKARLAFEAETGVRALLLVRDKATSEVFYQWLAELERGPKYLTSGSSRRVIYPLDSFHRATCESGAA